jgi:RND family efflux transporter MFP subunit
MMQTSLTQAAASRTAASDASTWQQLSQADAAGTFFQSWLTLQCGMIDGVTSGVLVLGPADTGPFAPVGFWPAGELSGPLLADVAQRALQSRQPLAVPGAPHSAVAYPVLVDGQVHGVVAVETALHSESALQDVLRRLQWGIAGIEALLRRQQLGDEQETRERLIATLDPVASTLAEEHFESAANALATELAMRLDCDRVSVGFVRDRHARVIAVSHSAQFGKRMNLIRAIGMAMDEALDQKSVIVLPLPEGEVLVTREHAALARQHGSDCILTIPFAIGELTSGAFTFERPAGHPFEPATVELCQAVTALCSRILEDKRLNDRLLVTRVKDAVQDQLMKLTGPRHFGRKLAAFVVMAAVVFFSFAGGDYRVNANATLEGAVRRVLAAPFDGYVATTFHRAGDVVGSGTVMATLDDRDLRLEYLKWASQHAQYTKQYQEAAAQHDRSQANILVAQVQQAQAQMALLAEQLARARIAAPFAGIVVSGDLDQSLGSTVHRGQVLFELAPLDAYRVVLEIDEGEIAALKLGQKGDLVLSSMAGEVFPFTVKSITPVTSSREGRSYFRVEAALSKVSERLRPGMEGVGKVEIGERKLAWIWTHKLVDWLRLAAWSWL